MFSQLRTGQAATSVLALIAAVAVLGLLFWTTGCGGGDSMMRTTDSQPGNANLQVNIGDGPADRLIAFSMVINSLTLTNNFGGTITLINTPTPVELTRLLGTMQTLGMMNVAPGTYTSATFSMGSAVVTYMDPVAKQPVQKTVGPMNATVNFNPAVTIGNTAMIMNFDMDMAASVSIDASGNVTVEPVFKHSSGNAVAGARDPEDGMMDHMTGTVASVSGNSFTMSMMQSPQNMMIATNSGTQFQNMSGMGMMANGMMVSVDAMMQPDGTMMAQRVESMTPIMGGMMADGLVTSITGNPATQLSLVAHNGAGTGMMSSALASLVTINVDSGTAYTIDWDGVDQGGLPFTPKFDSTTIFKGQRVGAESGNNMMSGGMGDMNVGTITASEIELEQQGFSGTVSAYSSNGASATFSLTLAPDSAFTTLTGATTITVFQQPGTRLRGLSSVGNGSSVHVRGLLLNDSGTYKLVASRIMAP
jgi:hypothetical protein